MLGAGVAAWEHPCPALQILETWMPARRQRTCRAQPTDAPCDALCAPGFHAGFQRWFQKSALAVGTWYPRARRALHVEQRCSTLAPVGRRKLAASLARVCVGRRFRMTISGRFFDHISKDFAPPKPQNCPRAAPTARYPRSDPTYDTGMSSRRGLAKHSASLCMMKKHRGVIAKNAPGAAIRWWNVGRVRGGR